MTDYMLSGHIADRLLALARSTSQSPEELLESLLDAADRSPQPNLLADLATHLSQAEFASGHANVAGNSRHILATEFGDHLMNRLKSSDNE